MRKVLFILSELADGDVDWMIQSGTKTTVPQGTVLIEEGKPIEVLYVVLDGQLAVTPARSSAGSRAGRASAHRG